MYDGTRVIRGPRPARPRTARTAAAVIAATAVALLAAACSGAGRSSDGSGGSPRAGASTNTPSAVAYSACMRFHGVPNFPDPDSKGMPGQADPQHLGVSSSRYQAAEQACQHLLPHRRLAAISNPAVPVVRRLSTDLAAAAPDRRAKVRPVPALPWVAQLARPHRRRQGPPCLRPQWCRHRPAIRGFVAVAAQGRRMPAPDRRSVPILPIT
jgi:hypothetical protein